jgi:hypothetical protein
VASIRDAQVGDELLCYMRVGLAIGLTITGDGRPFRFSPVKPRRARAADLTKFIGWVLAHDLDRKILRLQVSRVDHKRSALP